MEEDEEEEVSEVKDPLRTDSRGTVAVATRKSLKRCLLLSTNRTTTRRRQGYMRRSFLPLPFVYAFIHLELFFLKY